MLLARVQPSAGIKMVFHYSDELLIINKIAKSQPQWNVWYIHRIRLYGSIYIAILNVRLYCNIDLLRNNLFSIKHLVSILPTNL